MKAAVLYGANDLRYEDVETPKCPEGGILVKMIACGICGSDLRTYGRRFFLSNISVYFRS